MSLALENKIKTLEKRLKKQEQLTEAVIDGFQKELEKVKTDKDIVTQVLYTSMENYLRENVEFSMTTEGKIKELMPREH